MMKKIYQKSCTPPLVSKKDVLRYAGVKATNEDIDRLFNECVEETEGSFHYSVVYTELPISCTCDGVDMGFSLVRSRDLAKCLNGCDAAVIFAATVGIDIDRLIKKYAHSSPSRTVIMQAIGTERIEALCDIFTDNYLNTALDNEHILTPRFSPGYGDLPLELQEDIFRLLEPSSKIGITLNESLIMSPSKSVTAIFGIKRNI